MVIVVELLRRRDPTMSEDSVMIARLWKGKSGKAKAEAYQRHFTTTVVPGLKAIAGYKGAYLLRREDNGQVEFLALTLWDSLQTIKRFTGADPDVAIVEPEGMAALTEFDHFAQHYEVIHTGVTH
jgi:heme-degrading monooxygenase HmoA